MKQFLIAAFVLLLINNINAQDKGSIVANYEKGIKGVGYNGYGYTFGLKDNFFVFDLKMRREKKMKIKIPLTDRGKLRKLLEKSRDLMNYCEQKQFNTNKFVGDYVINDQRMSLEFEGRGKEEQFKGVLFINAFKKNIKQVYLGMSKFHVNKFIDYLSDKKYNAYLKDKK